jgi:basic membrane protein A
MGRREMETVPGLTVKFVESVDEGIQSEPILEYFAKNNYDLIFATSYGYMDPVIKIAKMYPDVIFMHCSGFKRSENVGTYFGRMYQPRYLTGMVAGAMTKSNLIGYVAAYPIPEVIRGINAFTLGVKSENPDAEVHVMWSKTWYDPIKEKSVAKALLDKGVDVITQHQDSPAIQVAAQKRNVYSIGYNTDMSKFAPRAHLTASIWNWKIIYKYIVDQVRGGTWKSQNIWWGMEKGVVDIAPISNLVPKNIREKVQAKRQELIKGQFFVFEGPLKDQEGMIRIDAGKKATDEQLLNMKWFVNGVVGKIE